MLFSDLYLIMKNPFYPKERRVKYYYIFVLITSIIPVVIAKSLEEEG
jgi:hypothetical protein